MFAQQIDAERVSLRCGTFPKFYKKQKELEKNYSPEAICRKKYSYFKVPYVFGMMPQLGFAEVMGPCVTKKSSDTPC